MSFVGPVSEEQADPQLRRLYRQVRESFGFLPNYFQALGRAPGVIEGQLALAGAILAEGALSRALKEQIGLVVSGINSSSYCIAAHMELLRRMGVETHLGQKLATYYEDAPLEEKEKVLFRFADKLSRRPWDVDEPDINVLMQAGWDQKAVLETVLTVSWFNFLNRVAFGLGVVGD